MKINKIFTVFIILTGTFLSSCQDELQKPILSNPSEFVAPVLNNAAASSESLVVTEEILSELFEDFTWNEADYGVQLPLNYNIQISLTEDFAESFNLVSTPLASSELSVDAFNKVVLEAGATPEIDNIIYIRVESEVKGVDLEKLHSNVITRTINPFSTSNCGVYCSMAIIGDATPGGWDVDTDMWLSDITKIDKDTWTITLELKDGKLKFRTEDGWTNNWGGSGMTGTGEAGGADIPVTAGWHKITFNAKTLDYSIEAVTTTDYTNISLIGGFNGWAEDGSEIQLIQDANNSHLWKVETEIPAGELKFRANNSWSVNWGSDQGYPSGIGVSGGSNINIPEGGIYTFMFNDVSGEYFILSDGAVYSTVGVLGSATADGWDADQDLIQNPNNPYLFSGYVTLLDGEAKFRADDLWDNDWGGALFPIGIGSKGGSNIAAFAGKYFITINTGTGEYSFLK